MEGNEIVQVVLIIHIFTFSIKVDCVVMYSLPPSDNFPHQSDVHGGCCATPVDITLMEEYFERDII